MSEVGPHVGGNIQPQLDVEEHNHLARAKRTTLVGSDGVNYNELKVNADGSINTSGGGGGGGSVTQGTVPWVIQEPLSVDDNGASLTVDGTVAITGAVDVSGSTVTIQEPLSIDDNGGSITVDGPLTDAQLRATPVPISGTVTITDGSGPVTVDGTVTANQGTSPWVTADNQTLVDNAGFTDGTSKVFPAGYIFDETAGTALTENDVAAARVDSKRAIVVVLEDGTQRGVNNRATLDVTDKGVNVHLVGNTAGNLPDAIIDGNPFTQEVSRYTAAGFIFDETAGTALSENDGGIARMDSKRAVIATIEDATTRGQRAAVSAGGALSVDTELPAAAALAAGQANPTTPTVGGASLEHTGTSAATTWDPVYHSFFDQKTGVTNASGAGTTIDMSTCPMSKFAIDVEFQSGTVTSYNIDLQGSLNGSTWYQIGNTTAAAGGNTLTFFVDKPVRFMRHFVNAIVGASGTVRVRILACGR